MSRLALCSVCDGDVGIGFKSVMNSVMLCPSFCAKWFQSCYDDFFTPSGADGALAPCGPSSLVCSPLSEITEDPAQFCANVGGFAVAEREDDSCYDGVPAALVHGKGAKSYWAPPVEREPWWRPITNLWPRSFNLNFSSMGMSRSLQDYAPSLVITMVVLIFAWYLWKGAD